MFVDMRQKVSVPVFVVLGTEDTMIGRSWLLEYCQEKYRGSLKVRRDDLLALRQNKNESDNPECPGVEEYLRRLQRDPETLSQIE